MSSTIQVGNRTFTTDEICQRLSNADLLPQLIREMIIDEILADWEIEINHKIPYDRVEFTQGCDRLSKLSGYQGLNQLQLYKIVDRHLRLQKFKESHWVNKIYNYFLQRKDSLDRVKFSIMQVDEWGLAEELFFRVQRGEQSFADLAFKYSQGDTAKDGGRIDTLDLDRAYPAIALHLHHLKPGQVSPIFTLDNLYTFVRLDSYICAELNDYLRQILLDELFEVWVQKQISIRLGLFEVEVEVDNIIVGELIDSTELTLVKSTSPVELINECIEFIEPSSSLFFPNLESVDRADLSSSASFFISQSHPTKITDKSCGFSLSHKFMSFLLFFMIFLGAGCVTVNIFDRVVNPPVNVELSEEKVDR